MSSDSNKLSHGRDELSQAFPFALKEGALRALSVLTENRFSARWTPFALRLGNEVISIPYRIYYEPPADQAITGLNRIESEMLDCLFTRHCNGFVRQKHLARIIQSHNSWIPCYVVPLIGEYVVEIIRVIQENSQYLKARAYADFVRANPDFLLRTEQRAVSYWDCYYRSIKRDQYPAFAVLDFLKSIAKDADR